jgi:hypothetical protein
MWIITPHYSASKVPSFPLVVTLWSSGVICLTSKQSYHLLFSSSSSWAWSYLFPFFPFLPSSLRGTSFYTPKVKFFSSIQSSKSAPIHSGFLISNLCLWHKNKAVFDCTFSCFSGWRDCGSAQFYSCSLLRLSSYPLSWKTHHSSFHFSSSLLFSYFTWNKTCCSPFLCPVVT